MTESSWVTADKAVSINDKTWIATPRMRKEKAQDSQYVKNYVLNANLNLVGSTYGTNKGRFIKLSISNYCPTAQDRNLVIAT